MKTKVTALISYILFWLIFFVSARLFFLLLQLKEVSGYELSTILATFYHGFKLDLSVTSYFLAIPLLAAIPALWTGGRWFTLFMRIYTYLLLVVCIPVIVLDANLYEYWGFRSEFSIFGYLLDPKDAAASATTFQIIVNSLITVGYIILFIFFYRKFVEVRIEAAGKARYGVPSTLITMILFAALIIPIRGGTGVAPLNSGSVYFSDKLFPNHAAVNIIWNFGHTAAYRKPVVNPYLFHGKEQALSDFEMLTSDRGPVKKVLKNNRPNVILIILESFGSYLVENKAADTVVTPRFNELKKEGIYFSNIYAAGSRTDKAIPAIISGYPNLPTIQVIRDNRKVKNLPSLPHSLKSAGYNSSFWYGGDINFASMNSFILTTGYEETITKFNFNPENYNSKWGVHDNVLLDMLYDSLNTAATPFFSTVLTLSSHEPFDVPMDPVFKGDDELSRFKNSVWYADRSLGEFIDKARKSDWWENTLVILIADHCRRNSVDIPVYSEEIYKIPMLWTGGALAVRDTVVSRPGCQFDLPLTLLNQMDIKGSFRFSKDLLSEGSNSFGFYTYNEGFAFITDTAKAIYDAKLMKNVEESGRNPRQAGSYGKSFLQILFDDYLGN